jgi:hypothetical protein
MGQRTPTPNPSPQVGGEAAARLLPLPLVEIVAKYRIWRLFCESVAFWDGFALAGG